MQVGVEGKPEEDSRAPPAAWRGVPCSPPARAGRDVTSGNVEVSVVPDLGKGLENRFCSRGPDLLAGLVSSAMFLPLQDLLQSPSSPKK